MSVLRCKAPFAVGGPAPRVYPAGALVHSSDPVVKGREHLFVPAEDFVTATEKRRQGFTRATVETASAAPGEKRQVATPSAPEAPEVKAAPKRRKPAKKA